MIRSNTIFMRRKTRLTVISHTVSVVDFENVTVELPSFTVPANTRPLNDRETKFLEEGQRAESFRVLNCSETLLTADDKLGVVGDIIQNHLGFDWRVVGSKPWGDGTRHNSYTIQNFQKAT